MSFKGTTHCTLKDMPAKAEELYLSGTMMNKENSMAMI